MTNNNLIYQVVDTETDQIVHEFDHRFLQRAKSTAHDLTNRTGRIHIVEVHDSEDE